MDPLLERNAGVTPKDRTILALNAGSATLKFSLHHAVEPCDVIVAGQTDGGDGHAEDQLDDVLGRLPRGLETTIAAIGHRIVHGGPRYTAHTPITPEVLLGLQRVQQFAPLHVPHQLALVQACQHRLLNRPQVACLDTAFHRDLPDIAQRLPLPRRFHDAGVRRYGFHGLAFASVVEQLLSRGEPALMQGRTILAHLGGGASLVALRNGKPIDTSMAFSPQGGLLMSTRCGDIDPGALAFAMELEHLTPAQIRTITARESGMLAISETSGDMRQLLAAEADDPRAAAAVAAYCYRLRQSIGAFAAALEGLDLLVFSGGVGEHAAPIRARVASGLAHLGVSLDSRRNAQNLPSISDSHSRVAVRIVSVDEQRQIALTTARLTAGVTAQ
ncbi:MAG: acetate/propionate family kinase [Acidobacteriota bacterium]